jgi:hypothetical protein
VIYFNAFSIISAAVVLRRDSSFKRSAYHATGLLQLQDSQDFPALDLSPEKIYEGHSSGSPKLFAAACRKHRLKFE